MSAPQLCVINEQNVEVAPSINCTVPPPAHVSRNPTLSPRTTQILSTCGFSQAMNYTLTTILQTKPNDPFQVMHQLLLHGMPQQHTHDTSNDDPRDILNKAQGAEAQYVRQHRLVEKIELLMDQILLESPTDIVQFILTWIRLNSKHLSLSQ